MAKQIDKDFSDAFATALNAAADVYARHIPEKGESWTEASIDQMIGKWTEEVGEVLTLFGRKYNPLRLRSELLDVINVSLMVVTLIDTKA